MKNNKENKSRCQGMIFLSLAILLLAGFFSLTMQLPHFDYSHEERVAAFQFNKSTLEELRQVDFYEVEVGFSNVGSGKYKKEVDVFLTNNGEGKPAKHTIELQSLSSTDVGEYKRATSTVAYETTRFGKTYQQSSKVTALLYPHVDE